MVIGKTRNTGMKNKYIARVFDEEDVRQEYVVQKIKGFMQCVRMHHFMQFIGNMPQTPDLEQTKYYIVDEHSREEINQRIKLAVSYFPYSVKDITVEPLSVDDYVEYKRKIFEKEESNRYAKYLSTLPSTPPSYRQTLGKRQSRW